MLLNWWHSIWTKKEATTVSWNTIQSGSNTIYQYSQCSVREMFHLHSVKLATIVLWYNYIYTVVQNIYILCCSHYTVAGWYLQRYLVTYFSVHKYSVYKGTWLPISEFINIQSTKCSSRISLQWYMVTYLTSALDTVSRRMVARSGHLLNNITLGGLRPRSAR